MSISTKGQILRGLMCVCEREREREREGKEREINANREWYL